jgi:hypothetical protein
MGVQVTVDEQLLETAERLTGEHDMKKLVEQSLKETINRRSKLKALADLVGQVEFVEGFDHKSLRKTRYDPA